MASTASSEIHQRMLDDINTYSETIFAKRQPTIAKSSFIFEIPHSDAVCIQQYDASSPSRTCACLEEFSTDKLYVCRLNNSKPYVRSCVMLSIAFTLLNNSVALSWSHAGHLMVRTGGSLLYCVF